jgi:hypothetical protein
MEDGYRIMYAYSLDSGNPQIKAPWNRRNNIPRVYTPEDTVVQTPNSDTPYEGITAVPSPKLRRLPVTDGQTHALCMT